MRAYEKPANTPSEQVAEWQRRGMAVLDHTRAEQYISDIGYYRLSAYCIPFYQPEAHEQFKPGVDFNDVLALYIFDRQLRLLVMDALERIEVAVRANLTDYMSITYGRDAFWYLDRSHFKSGFDHGRLLTDIQKLVDEERKRLTADENHVENRRSLTAGQKAELKIRLRKENAIRHFICEYNYPPLPPCWIVMEALTLGQLSHTYAGLRQHADQKAIARALGTHAELLESWLKTLTSIRNFCAHHSRLWNKELGISIKIPISNQVRWLNEPVKLADTKIDYRKRLYPVLVAMQSMLYTISPNSKWGQRLYQLLDRYPTIPRANMGMPDQWHKDPFWLDALNHQQTSEGGAA